jgi:phosphoglycerate dehydrogenase-like enzyme
MSAKIPVVLFAFNKDNWQQFLPDYDRAQFPPFEEVRVDISSLKPGQWEETLLARQPEVIVSGWGTPRFPDDLILGKKIPLCYACHITGTIKGFISRELIEQGLLVSNWGNSISHTIAEHALLLTLASLRSIPLWKGHMDGTERKHIATRSLHDKRVGIHGFGAIARHLVALLKPFGVTISSYSAGVPAALFAEHGVRQCKSLEELVSDIDIMIECEAWIPQTEGSVSARILGLLPKDAVFVNVGRGAVVDEVALGKLAREGKLNVGLDVYEKEPLPHDSPLQGLDNVILSPHIAGPTHDAFPLCGDQAMSNLKLYLSGKKEQIKGVVTLEVYDRIT